MVLLGEFPGKVNEKKAKHNKSPKPNQNQKLYPLGIFIEKTEWKCANGDMKEWSSLVSVSFLDKTWQDRKRISKKTFLNNWNRFQGSLWNFYDWDELRMNDLKSGKWIHLPPKDTEIQS